jgi:GH43 family beta-xylosidase
MRATTLRLPICVLWCAFAAQVLGAGNPIMPGADPHAVVLNGTVWVYPTWSDHWRSARFFAFSSTNLVDWQRHGPVLDFKDVPWIQADGAETHYAWAPALLTADSRYYFYYSVGPQNPTPSRIGVAFGTSPAGPFQDSGRPLLTGGEGFEAIDPMAFTDPKSGRTYLYAGGSAGATLRAFELNPDLVSLAREVPVQTPPQFTEGVFMHYYGGRYHLSYSHGGWREASYSVHYATADSPTGPWHYRGPILVSEGRRKGPGHHSFIRSPLTGEWIIVYHRWENQTGDGPYRGSRQLCIDRVEYDPEGLIRPIVMTGGSAEPRMEEFTGATNALADIRSRDPFILPDRSRGLYYLVASSGAAITVRRSRDLELWSEPRVVFTKPDGFWGSGSIWAPEMHVFGGKYYVFATFMNNTPVGEPWTNWPPRVQRGTQVLVADSPLGPFRPFANHAHTPAQEMALDGTLWVEQGVPHLVYCHEWVQIRDGTIKVARLKHDLSEIVGEPRLLFKASDASWTPRGRDRYVTDGPALHRSHSGKLFMLWSSFTDTGYTTGIAVSDSGTIVGPWRHHPEPLFRKDGGHAMIFRDLHGRLLVALHSPNRSPDERCRLFALEDTGETLRLRNEAETSRSIRR